MRSAAPQEQFQGWLAALNRAREPDRIVVAYSRLESLRQSFLKMNVLSFRAEAQTLFDTLRPQARRVPTVDLRIASIALTTGSTLLSRNLRDFRLVPGLVVGDWTR